eukprot:COSAG01_NODE_5593_length_4159_cov_2.227340_2_plen_84_part_00
MRVVVGRPQCGHLPCPGTVDLSVGAPLVLSQRWAQLRVSLPAGQRSEPMGGVQLELEGWAPGERATTIWLDDAEIWVNHSTAL